MFWRKSKSASKPQAEDNRPPKPACDLEFEKAHEQIKAKLSSFMGINPSATTSWINPYLEEETLGIAILQRLNRLASKRYDHTVSTKDNDDEPPPYEDADPSVLERETTKLRGEYWKHQMRLAQFLDVNTRPDSADVDEVLLFREHRDQYDRPYAWVLGREKCAAAGGCCGRTCGCCERPLERYLRPGDGNRSDENGQGRSTVGVFGHCTVECACCIELRGCYLPHSDLPPTNFSDSSE